MPNSLTKVIPYTLVYSTHPPVSVCGTGIWISTLRGFSRQQGSTTSALKARTRVSAQSADLPTDLNAYPLPPTQPIVGWPTSLRPLIAPSRWFRNVDRISIIYAFRPRLRGRLTLRRLTLRRNPWTFGDTVFHSVSRYSCQHSHFRRLQDGSRLSLHKLTERSATAHLAMNP